MQPFIDLLSQPPASFAWSTSADGQRTIGTATGAIVDIWPSHVEVALLFPPDDPALAAHNGALLLLIVTALRPEWNGAGKWLSMQLRMSQGRATHEDTQYIGRATFRWSAAESRVTVRLPR